MTISVDLFKPLSGKWCHSGVAEISDDSWIWDKDILEKIDAGQSFISPGVITKRYYDCVVDLIECETDPDKFFKHLYKHIK